MAPTAPPPRACRVLYFSVFNLEAVDPAGRLLSSDDEAVVAGKPCLAGAVAKLEALSVPNTTRRAPAYAGNQQKRLVELIHAGRVVAFPDALRFVRTMKSLGWPIAVASSSKNADAVMKSSPRGGGGTLIDTFRANVCGIDLKRGKPDPEILVVAATALRTKPANCFVAEAAHGGGMASLGIARLHDAAGLRAAGATLVVTNLDGVAIDALKEGRIMPSTP